MANKPLLLSPAGSMNALKSAINAGADEVYLGGADFNARINATNFDRNALIKAGEMCRNANVSLNITLNTLIYDKEFKSVLEYVSFLADKVMPDSLIVQDLGLAVTLRHEFPHLALHASTQMRIHSYLDAEYLKSLGFTRAVLARELPKEDIAVSSCIGVTATPWPYPIVASPTGPAVSSGWRMELPSPGKSIPVLSVTPKVSR